MHVAKNSLQGNRQSDALAYCGRRVPLSRITDSDKGVTCKRCSQLSGAPLAPMVKDCDVADVIVDGLARAAAAGINAAPDIAICIRVALEQRGLEIRNIPRR